MNDPIIESRPSICSRCALAREASPPDHYLRCQWGMDVPVPYWLADWQHHGGKVVTRAEWAGRPPQECDGHAPRDADA